MNFQVEENVFMYHINMFILCQQLSNIIFIIFFYGNGATKVKVPRAYRSALSHTDSSLGH